jgi:hypothetical protein
MLLGCLYNNHRIQLPSYRTGESCGTVPGGWSPVEYDNIGPITRPPKIARTRASSGTFGSAPRSSRLEGDATRQPSTWARVRCRLANTSLDLTRAYARRGLVEVTQSMRLYNAVGSSQMSQLQVCQSAIIAFESRGYTWSCGMPSSRRGQEMP